jgi:carnitine 3-dehydrogenase
VVKMHLNRRVRRVALVGTEGVGASWAVFYLANGFDVAATDPAPHAEATLRRFIDSTWTTVAALGLSPKASPEHLDFTTDLAEAVSDADFIQESGSDQESEKITLFSSIADAAPHASIIASSSSVVSMSVLQAACEHPARCVIGHPLDPPHLIPLVEVVGGQQTSDETICETMAFYESVGKKPIHLRKEMNGSAANRLQTALWREIAYLIARGALDVSDADSVVYWGLGLRWAAIEPSVHSHLAGGRAGIRWFLDSFVDQTMSAAEDRACLDWTPELTEEMVNEVLRHVGDRSLNEIARERDQALLDLLRDRSRRRAAPTSKPAGISKQALKEDRSDREGQDS